VVKPFQGSTLLCVYVLFLYKFFLLLYFSVRLGWCILLQYKAKSVMKMRMSARDGARKYFKQGPRYFLPKKRKENKINYTKISVS